MNTQNIIILVIGLLSIVTNGILLVVFFLDPLKKFRTLTNYLIISLTISDFLTGTAGFAYAFKATTFLPVLFAVLWSTIFSSFVTIFLLSCERLVMVLYPLRAKSIITKHRVCISIASNWIVSIIIGVILCGLSETGVYYSLSVCYTFILVLVLVLIAFYLTIIWKMKSQTNFQRDSICLGVQRIISEQQRLTGMLFLLVTILLLTVVPYVSAALVVSGYHIFGNPSEVPENLLAFARYYFPIELLSFAINPIIYAWRLPDCRKSLSYYIEKCPFISKKLNTQVESNTRSMPTTESVL